MRCKAGWCDTNQLDIKVFVPFVPLWLKIKYGSCGHEP